MKSLPRVMHTCVISLSTHKDSMKYVLVLSSFYREQIVSKTACCFPTSVLSLSLQLQLGWLKRQPNSHVSLAISWGSQSWHCFYSTWTSPSGYLGFVTRW